MAKKRNPASLRSIAEKAGLSLGAVSMAMRGDTSIPLKTSERVLQIAKDLGYQRNARVSELMTLLKKQALSRGMETLALVQAESTTNPEESPYLETTINHVRKRAKERGYGLEVFQWGLNGLNSGRFQQVIKARGIRALILEHTDRRFRILEDTCLPGEYVLQNLLYVTQISVVADANYQVDTPGRFG